ncbi:MAG TPA: NAD-dependent epimerase/dehydratase family protein [Myxococcota bacterium]
MTLAVVTGASGLLGSNLVVQLREQGVDVRALYRSDTTITHLRAVTAGVDFVQASLDDVDSLERAFAGADVVFHCAAQVSILPRVTPALVRANVDGTRHVLAAFEKAHVPRLVYVSSTVTIGLAGNVDDDDITLDAAPDADENTVWNMREGGLADGYSITKKDAEDLVLRAVNERGLDAVIACPAYLFGPMDTKPSSGKLILDVAKGMVPGVTPGKNSFVDVRDVARGLILMWHKGRRGERYILGGHTMRFDEMLPLIARRAGVKPPSWKIPRIAARVVGAIGDLQAGITGKEPLLTSAAVAWSFNPRFRVSSQKAIDELGYSISPIDVAIDDALAFFRAQRMLPARKD